MTDHFAQDEPHALAITRNIFANLNLRRPGGLGSSSSQGSAAMTAAAAASGSASGSGSVQGGGGWEEPLFDARELRGVVPPDSRSPWDVRAVLGRILVGVIRVECVAEDTTGAVGLE